MIPFRITAAGHHKLDALPPRSRLPKAAVISHGRTPPRDRPIPFALTPKALRVLGSR